MMALESLTRDAESQIAFPPTLKNLYKRNMSNHQQQLMGSLCTSKQSPESTFKTKSLFPIDRSKVSIGKDEASGQMKNGMLTTMLCKLLMHHTSPSYWVAPP